MPRSWKFVPAIAGLWLVTGAGLASAGDGAACTTCQEKVACPPFYYHYYEGGPKLKFKRACPRPICDPCNLPHYGYYQTCWTPWPYGADWSHCHQPTPAQMLPAPPVPPFTPKVPVVKEDDTGKKPGDMDKPKTPDKPVIPELPEPKRLDQTSYRPVPLPETTEPTTFRLKFVR